jgi:hypothetical protein
MVSNPLVASNPKLNPPIPEKRSRTFRGFSPPEADGLKSVEDIFLL